MEITYEWRGPFTGPELHAPGFGGQTGNVTWDRVNRHSLGWVTARADGALAGFVNVAWDGGVHAFVLDTAVDETLRRQGIGARLVEVAAEHARSSGCEWLHVDFEEHLRGFYLEASGFRPTPAGIRRL